MVLHPAAPQALSGICHCQGGGGAAAAGASLRAQACWENSCTLVQFMELKGVCDRLLQRATLDRDCCQRC